MCSRGTQCLCLCVWYEWYRTHTQYRCLFYSSLFVCVGLFHKSISRWLWYLFSDVLAACSVWACVSNRNVIVQIHSTDFFLYTYTVQISFIYVSSYMRTSLEYVYFRIFMVWYPMMCSRHVLCGPFGPDINWYYAHTHHIDLFHKSRFVHVGLFFQVVFECVWCLVGMCSRHVMCGPLGLIWMVLCAYTLQTSLSYVTFRIYRSLFQVCFWRCMVSIRDVFVARTVWAFWAYYKKYYAHTHHICLVHTSLFVYVGLFSEFVFGCVQCLFGMCSRHVLSGP